MAASDSGTYNMNEGGKPGQIIKQNLPTTDCVYKQYGQTRGM